MPLHLFKLHSKRVSYHGEGPVGPDLLIIHLVSDVSVFEEPCHEIACGAFKASAGNHICRKNYQAVVESAPFSFPECVVLLYLPCTPALCNNQYIS